MYLLRVFKAGAVFHGNVIPPYLAWMVGLPGAPALISEVTLTLPPGYPSVHPPRASFRGLPEVRGADQQLT